MVAIDLLFSGPPDWGLGVKVHLELPKCRTENDINSGHRFLRNIGSFIYMLWCMQVAINFSWPTVVLFVRVCGGTVLAPHFIF